MSDYVQCLIAAGWISAGDVDEDYQQYLQSTPNTPDDETMDYDSWLSMRAGFDDLNDEFKQLEREHPDLWDYGCSANNEADRLLRAMVRYEVALRY